MADSPATKKRIPPGVITRLSDYLGYLLQMKRTGLNNVSSQQLNSCTGVNAAQIRRDISYLGTVGRRGAGYEIDMLIGHIEGVLGSSEDHRIALIGAGRLGSALIRLFKEAEDSTYKGLGRYGFDISAVFEADPSKVGDVIDGVVIRDAKNITDAVRELEIPIGLVATPASAAQRVTDQLVDGGVKVVLNYTPALVSAPDHVLLHSSDPLRDLFHTLYFLAEGQRTT